MGYSRGTEWTDELIKEKVFEVVAALELDRMPSRKECETYFKNGCLASAITRRKSWYSLAAELGLPVKDSETCLGKRYETIAEEQLNGKGFDTRRMPQNFPYDILVDSSIKVDVKVSHLFKGPNGSFYAFNLEKPFCTCDIYLLYTLEEDGDNIKDLLIVPSKFVPSNTQISVGAINSKYYKYRDRWDYIESYSSFLETVV